MAIESYYLRNKVKYRTARVKRMLEVEGVSDDKVDQLILKRNITLNVKQVSKNTQHKVIQRNKSIRNYSANG